MKKIFYMFLAITFVCLQQKANAQQSNNARYNNVEFGYDKEEVHVKIQLNLRNYYIESGDSLTLTPLIRSASNVRELPNVVLIGEGNQGFYLYNRSFLDRSARRFSAASGRKNELYQARVPYEAWMNNSRLDMKIELNQIGGFPLHSYIDVLKDNISVQVPELRNQPDPGRLPYSYPKQGLSATARSRNENDFSNPADLPRETGIFDLRLSNKKSFAAADAAEIDKVKALIDWVMTNEKVSLVGVYISAYTSVDGIYLDNEQLTNEQALAIKRHLLAGNNYPDHLFYTEGKGEDWLGLTELVEQSGMYSKDEVLNIINNTGIFTGRERKLMELANGDPYRYMREYLFPQQWRIECRIVYRPR
ncbi:MAG: DUF3868 domain-containing protein [Prevotella sp.]|jgi:hypothetical protein|nr:DUF3868 domain-containing protein [Prevotella sp.]